MRSIQERLDQISHTAQEILGLMEDYALAATREKHEVLERIYMEAHAIHQMGILLVHKQKKGKKK